MFISCLLVLFSIAVSDVSLLNNEYTTGITIKVKNVDTVSPPITVIAIGALISAPAV